MAETYESVERDRDRLRSERNELQREVDRLRVTMVPRQVAIAAMGCWNNDGFYRASKEDENVLHRSIDACLNDAIASAQSADAGTGNGK